MSESIRIAKNDEHELRWGGLIMDPRQDIDDRWGTVASEEGDNVSWLASIRVGNDQGRDGACALFAIASWAQAKLNVSIPDGRRLDLYSKTVWKLKRRIDGGLTMPEAFQAAHKAGWLPGCTALRAVRDLAALRDQPVIAGYMVTPAWDMHRVQRQTGCLDHSAEFSPTGRHAVVIVAKGRIDSVRKNKWVYIENSWGLRWGYKGIGIMNYELHSQLIRGLWVIE